MNAREVVPDLQWLGKLIAGLVLGLSLGTLVQPDPMTVPAVGAVPSAVVGGLGLVVGAVLYTQIPSGCDCGGDCGC